MKYEYHEQEIAKDVEKTRKICEDLPDFVSRFIRGIQQRTEAKTRLEYAKDIRNFMEYAGGHLHISPKRVTTAQLESFNRDFFEDYLDYLQRYEKDGKIHTNGRSGIKRKLSTLRKLYNFLVVNEYIQVNNIVKVEVPKIKDKEIIFLDEDESRNFLSTVRDGFDTTSKKAVAYHNKQQLRDMTLVTLLLSTGIRVSECVGLDIEAVDMKNHCIRIMRKGGKEGIVYFSDDAATLLDDYMIYRRKTEAPEEEKALFLSSRKTRLSVRSIQTIINKYARVAIPLKKITPHKLRSTYGTALYEKTNDIYIVATVLGHSNINTTAKHYSNISNRRKEEIRNVVKY